MAESIIIIGAGMGGLAAGIYGQANGYQTQIFEMHTKPGGQCAAWKRGGYTFDACFHHVFGCKEGSGLYRMWHELGAMPRERIPLKECTAIAEPGGKMFIDYYDLDRLRDELIKLSPADSRPIDEYVAAIRSIPYEKLSETMAGGSFWNRLASLPAMFSTRKWVKMTMREFAERFSDPFLRKAFALAVYSDPTVPVFFHLMRHAAGLCGDVQWPAHGAAEFAKSIESRYLELGGQVHYASPVQKILVENDKAVGVRLAGGAEHRADIVISNADGRKTILDMLDGKYINDTVRAYCAPIQDETPFALDIFLGVNRDLSREPSSLILMLDRPVTIANHNYEHIEAQTYGFDKTMAPEGKGVIKVELPGSYAYWKQLYTSDREKYKQEKQAVADGVIDILDTHFAGIKSQVEVLDITTLMTWERYMGGSQGWFTFPNRKFEFSMREEKTDKAFKTTLPGLSNFYFVGVWATMMGSLFDNAKSGKTIISRICKKDRKRFKPLP